MDTNNTNTTPVRISVKKRTTKKRIARRLRKLGLSWKKISWAIYGVKNSTMAFYTAKR